MHILHKWTKWERVSPGTWSMNMTFTHIRTCLKCGKTKLLKLNDGNGVE